MNCNYDEIPELDVNENGDIVTVCVKDNSGNGEKSDKKPDWWSRAMEAADKILKGAEILKGGASSTTTRRGDFGGDVITYDRNGMPNRNTRATEPTPSVFDDKIVLIGGGLLLVGFLFLMFKAFGKKKDAASVVAPVMK